METIPRVKDDSVLLHKIKKPQHDIDQIIHYLNDKCNKRLLDERRKIRITKENQHQCLILFSGSIALYRSNDGLIINSESGPYIFGVNSQLHFSQHIHLRTLEKSRVGLIPLHDAYEIIAKQQLWESVSRLLAYSSAKIYSHCFEVSKLSSYEIILHQLEALNNESLEIRQKITAANYILSRTLLSRSGVMKILAKLRNEGYIVLSRGVLVQINQLPQKRQKINGNHEWEHDDSMTI